MLSRKELNMIKDIKLEGIGSFLPRHPAGDTSKKKDNVAIEKNDVAVELKATRVSQVDAGAIDRVSAAKMAIENGSYVIDKNKLAKNIYHQLFGDTAGNDNT